MLTSAQVKLLCCGDLTCTGMVWWEGLLVHKCKWRSHLRGDIQVCKRRIEGDL